MSRLLSLALAASSPTLRLTWPRLTSAASTSRVKLRLGEVRRHLAAEPWNTAAMCRSCCRSCRSVLWTVLPVMIVVSLLIRALELAVNVMVTTTATVIVPTPPQSYSPGGCNINYGWNHKRLLLYNSGVGGENTRRGGGIRRGRATRTNKTRQETDKQASKRGGHKESRVRSPEWSRATPHLSTHDTVLEALDDARLALDAGSAFGLGRAPATAGHEVVKVGHDGSNR